MQCPGCNSIWKDGYSFCAHCGTELVTSPGSRESGVKKPRCSRCGRLLPPHYRFCDFCGAPAAGAQHARPVPTRPAPAVPDEDGDVKVFVPAARAVPAAQATAAQATASPEVSEPAHHGVRVFAAGVISPRKTTVVADAPAVTVEGCSEDDAPADVEVPYAAYDEERTIVGEEYTDDGEEYADDEEEYIEEEYADEDEEYAEYGEEYADEDEEYAEDGEEYSDEDEEYVEDDEEYADGDEYAEDYEEYDEDDSYRSDDVNREVNLLEYDELADRDRLRIGVHNPHRESDKHAVELEKRYAQQKKSDLRYVFVWLMSLAAVFAATFLPLFCEGGGLIPSPFQGTVLRAFSSLAADRPTDGWALIFSLAVLVPALLLLVSASIKRFILCRSAAVLGILALIAAAATYCSQLGAEAAFSLNNGAVQIGCWVVLALYIISIPLCPRKQKSRRD